MVTEGIPAISASDLVIDRELASIGESFRFLLDVTPVNADTVEEAFLSSPTEPPRFEYRDLEDKPEVIEARLAALDLKTVNDPTLAHLFEAKRRELKLQLEMLGARDTSDFLPLSVELYGGAPPSLVEQAEELLATVRRTRRRRGRCCDAEIFAKAAAAEIEHYRNEVSDLGAHVEVRDDTVGIMVANGDLLVSRTAALPESRMKALLAHEIGTHIVTYLNGSRQPLRLLAVGLAGYEETQEGLAMLAEALVGGLTGSRLRQLAARVVAVHRLVQGSTFQDTHAELIEVYGYSPRGAFGITMRVYRSGGFTKDAVYLRGLQGVLEHVEARKTLDLLWLGKLSLTDLPLVEDLWSRGFLTDPLLRPRFLSDPDVAERLAGMGENATLKALVGSRT